MKTSIRILANMGMCLGCLCMALGCRTSSPQEAVNSPAQVPVNDAANSSNSPLLQIKATAPASGPFAKFHPVKIVHNGDHVVLVQSVEKGFERGKYLIPATSSQGASEASAAGYLLDPEYIFLPAARCRSRAPLPSPMTRGISIACLIT